MKRLAIVWLAGCGRIAFEPLGGDGRDTSDAITATGQLDPTFGGTGVVQPSSATGNSRAYDVIARDPTIVVTGTDFSAGASMNIVSLNEDGTRDTAFANGGELIVKPSGAGTGYGYGMTALADGNILLLGDASFTNDDFLVAKISAGGVLQPAFGGDGFASVDVNLNDTAVRASVVNGIAYVCGNSNYSNDMSFSVVGIRTTDGMLDTSFQALGILDTNYSVAMDDECDDIASFGGGLVAADTSANNVKLVSVGIPTGSTNFSTGIAGISRALAIRDGRIVVAAVSGTTGLLLRFDTLTSLDPTFGSGGVASVIGDTFADVTFDDVGRIVAVGRRNALYPVVSRFLANGSPDPSFGTNGSFVLDTVQAGELHGVVLDRAGRIVAVGSVNDGLNHMTVLRLN